MKTSRTKSFRLHHMNKTGSLRKTSQSFLDPDESFKLAALNSVTRGIKKADLSMITGDDLCKLRVEPLQDKNAQEISAHCSLMSVRVRYDEMKKRSAQNENRIAKQKDELRKLEIVKNQYQGRKAGGEDKVKSMEDKLIEIRSLLEETHTQLKVLLSMRARHISDRVVYDQRKFELEQLLAYHRKQLGIYKKEGMSVEEGTDRTTKVYEKLQAELNEQQQERQTHIANLEAMIEEKLALINANQQREAELAEIASRAIQDKGNDEKHWRMVHLTHVFVSRMLRHKIEVQMEKFKTVEQAFKTIKTATGVSDAKTLINKYLSKESVYGELLGKIADNERDINGLKAEGEQLILQSKTLQAEKEVLQSIKIKSQDLHDTIKEFQAEDEKSQKAYELNSKLKQWVHRQLKKLYTLTGSKEEEPEKAVEAMRKFLEGISKIADTVEADNLYREEGDAGHHDRIVRVLPKRSRKNSAGEEIFDVDEEDLNPGINHEQSDFINAQHDQLIHANEKFMREVKRRAEEERKLLIDKHESKAKNTKPVEIKKEED